MLELRTIKPDSSSAEPDLAGFIDGLTELAARFGIVEYVNYATTPSGSVLSYGNMTTLVAADGAIRKKITEFKTASKKPDHEQRSED